MAAMGLVSGNERVAARTNVAPTVAGVAEPSVHAFTYTVPRGGRTGPAFRLSGATETRLDGSVAERLWSIVEVLDARMAELGVGWDDSTAIAVYGASADLGADSLARFGAAAVLGITWYPALPPIRDREL